MVKFPRSRHRSAYITLAVADRLFPLEPIVANPPPKQGVEVDFFGETVLRAVP
jgi:hypothetical protein